MKGKVAGIFAQPVKEGSAPKWNVMVETEQGAKGYICFNPAIVGMHGKEIEYTEEAPKFGTTPLLKFGGAPKFQKQFQQGRDESFALSYAKDIAIACMGRSTEPLGQTEIDNILNHYFNFFMERLKKDDAAK